MDYNALFFLNSALLGVGLAMDAFSVSLANGLNESGMRPKRMCQIAGVFGGFQALMPMLGWICVHTIAGYFQAFRKFIPWIALILLCYIGGEMLIGGIRGKNEPREHLDVGMRALFIQGVATSIDALSVGFTIADYNGLMALVCSLIIAAVTFFICMCGLLLGKSFGTRLAGKAEILGGVILIAIGVEIFLSNMF
ncbi:manganese efflux pump MntP family protein [Ruminococcus sp. 5_1_39BFAA]|uniref:manganese efflux pump MntP n=1 Tax=Ruminococcus sp. 5_1_39BFAA TaxID=457412 RepID=UPI003564566C